MDAAGKQTTTWVLQGRQLQVDYGLCYREAGFGPGDAVVEEMGASLMWLLLQHQLQQKIWDAAETFLGGFGLASAGIATGTVWLEASTHKRMRLEF
jgi:hypothetical protein